MVNKQFSPSKITSPQIRKSTSKRHEIKWGDFIKLDVWNSCKYIEIDNNCFWSPAAEPLLPSRYQTFHPPLFSLDACCIYSNATEHLFISPFVLITHFIFIRTHLSLPASLWDVFWSENGTGRIRFSRLSEACVLHQTSFDLRLRLQLWTLHRTRTPVVFHGGAGRRIFFPVHQTETLSEQRACLPMLA